MISEENVVFYRKYREGGSTEERLVPGCLQFGFWW